MIGAGLLSLEKVVSKRPYSYQWLNTIIAILKPWLNFKSKIRFYELEPSECG